MFYDPRLRDHGLPFDPVKAIVAPRPIGWISTVSATGVFNLAPYSFFNLVSAAPDMVMFSSDGWKDSVTNIRDTGEFTCNLATGELTGAMNRSSATVGPEVDEFVLAGLEAVAGTRVRSPRVRQSPAALECIRSDIIELKSSSGQGNYVMVIGEVVGVHIDDAFIRNGRFDTASAAPRSRLGYRDYARFGDMVELGRPGDG